MKRAAKIQEDRVRQRTSTEKFKLKLSKLYSHEGAMFTTQVVAFSYQVFMGSSLAAAFASQALNAIANLSKSCRL